MSEIVGTARLGKRTKDLVKRLRPGDLAIIDHVDLDRVSAEELVSGSVLERFPTGVSLVYRAKSIQEAGEVFNAYRDAAEA